MSKKTLGSLLLMGLFVSGCGGESESARHVSCEEICMRIEAPRCENSPVNCLATCEQERAETPVECTAEIDRLSTCFADATFHCDADGVAQANGCASELEDWLSCSRGHGE